MRLSIDAYYESRANVKALRRDEHSENIYAEMSSVKRALLALFPVRVGDVDWGAWPDDDPRKGTPRTLPMYLLAHRHSDGRMHRALSYRQGFSGHNERLTCPCGYTHYTSSVLLGHVQAFGQLVAYGIRFRLFGRRRVP